MEWLISSDRELRKTIRRKPQVILSTASTRSSGRMLRSVKLF